MKKIIAVILIAVLIIAGCLEQPKYKEEKELVPPKDNSTPDKNKMNTSMNKIKKENQTLVPPKEQNAGSKKWYKAQFHVHSPCYEEWRKCQSGSPNWRDNYVKKNATLADFIEFHKDAGYQIVAVSDYGIVTKTSQFTTSDFLTIPNTELTNIHRHLNAIGVTRQPQLKNDNFQENIDEIKSAGGLVQINHPNNPKQITAKEILALKPSSDVLLMEVVSSWGEDARNNWISVWDGVLSAGQQIYGTGTSDWHGDKNGITSSWTMIRASSLEYDDVVDAVRKGDFYGTTGPLIEDIQWENNTLTIELPEIRKIKFFGSGQKILYSVTSNKAYYTLEENELFVRAEVYEKEGREGKMAATQAYFNEN